MSEKHKPVSYQCPSCGHPVPVGSPVCPGCQRIFTQEDIGKYSYQIEKERLKYEEKKSERNYNNKIGLAALGILLITFLIIQIRLSSFHNQMDSDNRKLESIYVTVQQYIIEEKYDEAMTEALKLQPDTRLGSDHEKKWEDRKDEIIQLIQEKQKNH